MKPLSAGCKHFGCVKAVSNASIKLTSTLTRNRKLILHGGLVEKFAVVEMGGTAGHGKL